MDKNYTTNASGRNSVDRLKKAVHATPYISNNTIEVTNQQSPIAKARELYEDELVQDSHLKMSATLAQLPRCNTQIRLATDDYASNQKLPQRSVISKSTNNKTQLTAKTTKASNLEKQVKDKLQYDWKNIYRRLNAGDVDDSGKVPMTKFEKTLR